MDCAEVEPQLIELALGELGVEETGALRAHLAQCPECTKMLAAYEQTLTLMQQQVLEEPLPEVDARILEAARVHRDKVTPFGTESFGRRAMRFAPQFAMAAAAILAVGVGFWSTQQEQQLRPAVSAPVLNDEAPKIAYSIEPAAEEAKELRVEMEKTNQAKERVQARVEYKLSKPSPRAKKRRSASSADYAYDSENPLAGIDALTSPIPKPAKRKAATKSKTRIEPHTLLAKADRLYEKDEYLSAITHYMDFLRRWPKHQQAPRAKLQIARSYRALDHLKLARFWYQRALREPSVAEQAQRELDSLGSH